MINGLRQKKHLQLQMFFLKYMIITSKLFFTYYGIILKVILILNQL
jgi:hypothetical protein